MTCFGAIRLFCGFVFFPEKTGKKHSGPSHPAEEKKLIRLMARNQYDELNNWSDVAVDLLPRLLHRSIVNCNNGISFRRIVVAISGDGR